MPTPDLQCARAVLMIRPKRFHANAQTRGSNAFQRHVTLDPAEQQARAAREFDGLATALCEAGVRTYVFDDTPEPAQREAVVERLRGSGREVVTISRAQMQAFAGNMLALEDQAGRQVLAMSGRAEASLSPAQREALTHHARLVAAPIDTIEESAGGSVRCMLAEVFLPEAAR